MKMGLSIKRSLLNFEVAVAVTRPGGGAVSRYPYISLSLMLKKDKGLPFFFIHNKTLSSD